jgi:hypothetical protein
LNIVFFDLLAFSAQVDMAQGISFPAGGELHATRFFSTKFVNSGSPEMEFELKNAEFLKTDCSIQVAFLYFRARR